MIIEIAGIDGAGKTTQIERLARLAQEAGIPCYERTLRSTGRRIVGGIAAQRGHHSWWDIFDRSAVELATALEMFQLFHATVVPIQFPGQIVVTDHYVRGWLAVAIAEASQNIDQLSAIYSAMPTPDVSVQLDCNVNAAFARILARPKGDHILRSGGRARLSRLAAAYDAELDKVVSYETVRLDGEARADEIGALILKLVRDWAADNDPLLYERLSAARSPGQHGATS